MHFADILNIKCVFQVQLNVIRRLESKYTEMQHTHTLTEIRLIGKKLHQDLRRCHLGQDAEFSIFL